MAEELGVINSIANRAVNPTAKRSDEDEKELRCANPLIEINKVLNQIAQSLTKSKRDEDNLSKEVNKNWEKESDLKAALFPKIVKSKDFWNTAGGVAGGIPLAGNFFANGLGNLLSKHVWTALTPDNIRFCTDKVGSVSAPLIQQFGGDLPRLKHEDKLTKQDYYTAISRSNHEQGKGNSQGLDQALSRLRETQSALLRLEAKNLGAPT